MAKCMDCVLLNLNCIKTYPVLTVVLVGALVEDAAEQLYKSANDQGCLTPDAYCSAYWIFVTGFKS